MNPVPIILGIDPGITGGIAIYAPSGSTAGVGDRHPDRRRRSRC